MEDVGIGGLLVHIRGRPGCWVGMESGILAREVNVHEEGNNI